PDRAAPVPVRGRGSVPATGRSGHARSPTPPHPTPTTPPVHADHAPPGDGRPGPVPAPPLPAALPAPARLRGWRPCRRTTRVGGRRCRHRRVGHGSPPPHPAHRRVYR